ncbi:MAG: Cytochrome bd-I ubiquinol oxidase subunit 2 [Legionellaceae bacterium]
MNLDYELLRIIWWVLVGVLLVGFAIMDGFDLGVAALLPVVAKNDLERRIVINTVGPVWEGNQVWFILGGGAIFAAWPLIYSVSFSGFYIAMFVVLVAFILRPVSFKFRSKLESKTWRTSWDYAISYSGFIPALIFGVALGNVLQGVPFQFDNMLRMTYSGTFWQLLNPFALLSGLLSVAMLLMHGALYLTVKTEDAIQQRARLIASITSILVIILFALGGYCIAHYISGYELVSAVSHNQPSNPLNKQVIPELGQWISNYSNYPFMLLAPCAGFLGAIIVLFANFAKLFRLAFIGSSLSIMGIISTVGLSMYPFILPSSSNPNNSLLLWDASSSEKTLLIMLFVTAIFMPIIIAYTAWVYRIMRGKVIGKHIDQDTASYY